MQISWLFSAAILAALVLSQPIAQAGFFQKKKPDSALTISRDASGEKVVVSWTGGGVLRQAASLKGKTRLLHKGRAMRRNVYMATATAGQTIFSVEEGGSGGGANSYSANAVGYVNLKLPPGLSLIANPLIHPDNSIAYWFSTAPDGCQIYKLDPTGNYEVATFDGLQQQWSNPGLAIPLGVGFYFYNPSATTYTVVFVGEVAQGQLINPLPAGISTKGSLVPQFGSINTLHHIPGEPGDQIQVYINDLAGGGAYQSSVYTAGEGWVPDLILQVGQGFWIEKQNSQDWVRGFFVN